VVVCALFSKCQGLVGHANPFPKSAEFTRTLEQTYANAIAVQKDYRVKQYCDSYDDSVRKCLEGKKVTILGNSISRHWFSVLRDILESTMGNQSMDDEKNECGQGGVHGGVRPGQGHCYGWCGCSTETSSNTKLEFLWQQRVYDPEESDLLRHDCADLLTINTGGDDIFDPGRRPAFKETLENELSQLRNMLTDVIAVCPETKFYWRTTTPVCADNFDATAAELNEMINYSNDKIRTMLSEAKLGLVFDSWTANLDRCGDYDDTIHHSKLVEEHLHSVLTHYCGKSELITDNA